jgi:hypothetical protein
MRQILLDGLHPDGGAEQIDRPTLIQADRGCVQPRLRRDIGGEEQRRVCIRHKHDRYLGHITGYPMQIAIAEAKAQFAELIRRLKQGSRLNVPDMAVRSPGLSPQNARSADR